MSKKKTEIHPIRAERIKELIKREKINQKELAGRIFQSQQNINRIVQEKQPLTEETARDIIKVFPEYRLEWLLGYDDFRTKEDLWRNGVLTEKAIQNAAYSLLSEAFRKTPGSPILDTVDQVELDMMQAQIRDFAASIAWNYTNRHQSQFWISYDIMNGNSLEN